jgi:small subunit ribosomal protein S4
MKKQSKKYSRPRKPFDKIRIEEENLIREKYGLKNKKEIWKADASIGKIRNLAKKLIASSEEEKQAFIEKLKLRGFEINNIADALALNKEDWLKRRLQTMVFTKKLTTTPKQARQFVVHKHVKIGNNVVNIPSYQVNLEEEALIKLDLILKKPIQKKGKMEEIKEEVIDENKIQTPEEINEEVEKEEVIKEDKSKTNETPIENKPMEIKA